MTRDANGRWKKSNGGVTLSPGTTAPRGRAACASVARRRSKIAAWPAAWAGERAVGHGVHRRESPSAASGSTARGQRRRLQAARCEAWTTRQRLTPPDGRDEALREAHGDRATSDHAAAPVRGGSATDSSRARQLAAVTLATGGRGARRDGAPAEALVSRQGVSCVRAAQRSCLSLVLRAKRGIAKRQDSTGARESAVRRRVVHGTTRVAVKPPTSSTSRWGLPRQSRRAPALAAGDRHLPSAACVAWRLQARRGLMRRGRCWTGCGTAESWYARPAVLRAAARL